MAGQQPFAPPAHCAQCAHIVFSVSRDGQSPLAPAFPRIAISLRLLARRQHCVDGRLVGCAGQTHGTSTGWRRPAMSWHRARWQAAGQPRHSRTRPHPKRTTQPPTVVQLEGEDLLEVVHVAGVARPHNHARHLGPLQHPPRRHVSDAHPMLLAHLRQGLQQRLRRRGS